MKFKDIPYSRPEQATSLKEFAALTAELEACEDAQSFIAVFKRIEEFRSHIYSLVTIASIRHSINTADEFYDRENDYWDEAMPLYSVYENRIAKCALAVNFKEELYSFIPKTYFDLAACQAASFDEKIVPLLQEENRLCSEYGKLKAAAKIEFAGQTYNLATIAPLTKDPDRSIRQAALKAKYVFYEEHETEFDDIFDRLVKLRDKIAKELGYKNFIELGYKRMSRLDYNQEMVANYRRQIVKDLVPLTNELYERQRLRLGLDKLTCYDEDFKFLSGNPAPKGSYDEMIAAAKQMYHELSPETGAFIDRMIDDELWDLQSRDNKELGGYCTSISEYKAPFIFANFNGTSGDVDVLSHEAGHAFQYYLSADIPVLDVQWGTLESAEINSMSMEFFTWPWSKLFFKEDDEKYHYLHLSSALEFLPYGCLIDHFQHEVYAHVDWSPAQRKAVYRQLEKQYLPHKNYEGFPFLEKGAYWYQQGHVFQSPFYYIDYTLAQICALQYWTRIQEGDKEAWNDYIKLSRLGGCKSFLGLVADGGLQSPFTDGCVKRTVESARKYLAAVDDKKL